LRVRIAAAARRAGVGARRRAGEAAHRRAIGDDDLQRGRRPRASPPCSRARGASRFSAALGAMRARSGGPTARVAAGAGAILPGIWVLEEFGWPLGRRVRGVWKRVNATTRRHRPAIPSAARAIYSEWMLPSAGSRARNAVRSVR
jgi:hypothetical protein